MAATSVDESPLTRELRPELSAEAALVEADRCLECGGPYAPAPLRGRVSGGDRRPGVRLRDRRRRSPGRREDEAYLNTGVQRSGATPFGAFTTTSEVGAEGFGKAQTRKDMTAIAVSHHVPYVAQAVASHWDDLSAKSERAAAARGPAFLNVLTDCPVGWGHEPRLGNHVLDAAVETMFWPLYEVVDGEYRLTYRPERQLPIEHWLGLQARFAHLLRAENRPLVDRIQTQVDDDWADLVARCATGD